MGLGCCMFMVSFVDLGDVVESLSGAWSPVDVARVNDQVVRAALFDGEYHWHKHDDEDELFFVYSGAICIHVKDQDDIRLEKGQLCVIPKGAMHKPESSMPSIVLLFEPAVLKSKGD
jgi:mannose-6-phosphate isomerase-like protein (cupin superfamily)